MLRELKSNSEQIANSEYASTFQRGTPKDATIFFGMPMTAETMSGWVTDAAARKRYIEAFGRSDFDAMLNYYKANYPKGSGADTPTVPDFPKVKAPVLLFHGLGDRALHRNGLAGAWDWVDQDLTLVTIPERRAFRPAGRRGAGDLDDEVVVDDAALTHGQTSRL